MSWKEFFKITKPKIMLFAILFLIFSFIHTWPVLVCGSWECMPFSKGTFWSSLISLKNKEFFDFGYFPLLVYKFIVSIIIAYIASSFIIKILLKLREQKK